jgi:hypothetical protein
MSIESRVQRLEDEVQALKTNDLLFEQRLSAIGMTLDEVNTNVKTGWERIDDSYREQMRQLREDRQKELERQSEERRALREESRWWWTKAFGIATTVLGILSAAATGTYYSMQAEPAPIAIVQPPESVP